MTLSVQLTYDEVADRLNVSIARHGTGQPAGALRCGLVCDTIEPAIYEHVRDLVTKKLITRATVTWDGETIRIPPK